MEFEDSINITFDILDYIFQRLETEDVPVKQIMPCLAFYQKKVKMLLPNMKKTYFCEKLKIIWKNSKWPWEVTFRFLRRSERRQNLGITAYTLENYSNFKSKLSFNNGNIFEIHDCFRTRGNANDLSQLVDSLSLSNQDFAGLDNFNRLENLLSTQGVARNLNWCC